jgi:electron transfer flavoprotein alpha subunit
MVKDIWVLPEISSSDEEISKRSLGLLTEARNIAEKVGGNITALLFSKNARQISGVLGKYGVNQVYLFLDPIFQRFSVEAYAASIMPRLRLEKPWLLLMGHTAIGKELAPHLASLLDTAAVTDCVKIDVSQPENPRFYRPVYGGQIYQEIVLDTDATILVTMEANALNDLPAKKESKPKTVLIESELPADLIKTRHLEFLPADVGTVDVTEAETIVSAGMGAISDEIYTLVTELAGLVEGAIGTTRLVADAGKISKERMIGQTGKTVSPDFYLALGISGATHHTGGIQESGRIVAINRDRQASIFQSADAGAVADLREVLPKLIEKIKQAKKRGEIL